jgi:hypothetical protein
MRVLISCPEQHRDSCNHLSAVLGFNIDYLESFTEGGHEKDGVRLKSVQSQITDRFISKLEGELYRPAFDTENLIDMDKANQAKALLAEEGNFDDVANHICYAFVETIQQAHVVMVEAGIVPIEVDLG